MADRHHPIPSCKGTPWARKHEIIHTKSSIPPKVDLRKKMAAAHIEIYDQVRPSEFLLYILSFLEQQKSESCTANAICAAWRLAESQVDPRFRPSRLFLYFNERDMKKHSSTDSGARVADGCKSLQTNGVCSEQTWPFNLKKVTVRPPKKAYEEAKPHKIHTPAQIHNDFLHVKDSLAQGKPVIIGIVLYSDFYEAGKTGIVHMPGPKAKKKGGHAVLIVGYDNSKKHWIVRNSWGEQWGDKG